MAVREDLSVAPEADAAPQKPAHWPAAIGYLLLACLVTFPAALRLGTHLVGMDDAQVFVWELWWFQRALMTLHVDPLHTDLLFYPMKAMPLIWSTAANVLPGIPLTALVGPVAAYNLLVLSGLALSGYAAYRLAWRFVKRRDAAFLAGMVFALAPAHTAQIVEGHLGVLTIQWAPLAVLALLRLHEAPRLGRAMAFAAALALVLVSDLYVAVYFLGVLGLVAGAWALRHREAISARFAALTALGGGLAVAIAAPFHWPTYRTLAGAGTTAVQAGSIDRFGQDVAQLLLPTPSHPLLGGLSRWAAAHVANYDSWGTIGLTAAALAGVALWRVRGSLTRFWGAVTALAVVGSLGTHLNVLGPKAVPMPYALVAALPVLKNFRVPGRLAEVTALGLAMLAAVGAAWWFERLGKRARVAFAALATALLLEGTTHAPFPTTSAAVPAFYRALAADPAAGAILELPNGDANWGGPTHRWMLYQTAHGHPLVVAHTHRIPDGALDYSYSTPFLMGLAHNWNGLPASLPIAEAREQSLALRRDGITHVIVHRLPGTFDGPVYAHMRAQLGQLFGAPLYEDATMAAFATPGPPVRAGAGR